MAESDKPGQKKTTTRRTTGPASRKKVTRAPVIDLEATEIPDKPAADKAASETADPPPAETPKAAEKETAAAEKIAKAGTAAAATPAPAKKDAVQEKPGVKKAGQPADESVTQKPAAEKSETGNSKPDKPEKDSTPKQPARPAGNTAAPLKDPAGSSGPARAAATARDEKTGMLAFAGAGAAGAFVCFVIIAGLDQLDLIPWNASSSDQAAVTQRIDALEKRIAESTSETQAVPDYGGRIEALEGRVGEITTTSTTLAGEVSGQREAAGKLEARLEQTTASAEAALAGVKNMEASVKAIGQSTAEGDAGPSVNALALKLSSLSSRLDSIAEDLKASLPDGLDGKLSTLDETAGGLSTAVTEIKTALAKLETDIDALPVAANSQGIADLKGDVSGRLDAIETRLGGPGETRGAAAAIALAGLRRAVGTGRGFANEFAAFKSLVPSDPLVAVVEPHVQTGIATRDDLTTGFTTVLAEINSSGEAASQTDDLVSGLISRLESVVKVRKTGAGDALDEASVAARMAVDLKSGDLAAAVKGAKSIAGPVSTGMTSWLALAEARLTAEAALDEADQRMLAALARTGD